MTVKQSLSGLTTRKGNLINSIWLDRRGDEAIGERCTPLWMAEAPPERSQKPRLDLHQTVMMREEPNVTSLPTSVCSSQRGMSGKHCPCHTPSN